MSEKISAYKKYIADILLVTVILCLALSVFLIVELTREDGAYAVVTVGGEEYASYPLDRDGEYVLNDGTNILVIRGGEAYMEYADCPDGLCKGQGHISRGGERIVCLPNRVEVSIIGSDEEIIPIG